MKLLLIVEDEDMKARMLQRVCRAHGLETVRAATMVGAMGLIENAAQMGIAAVITDWQFPVRSEEPPRDHAGQFIWNAAQKAGLPVAVCSGRDVPVDGITPWIKTGDLLELNTWIKKTKLEVPELGMD